LTAGTRRNGSSKFGSFKRVASRFGGLSGQAEDGRDVEDFFGHDEYGDLPSAETAAYAEDGSRGYAEDGSHGYGEPATLVGLAGDAVQAGHDEEPGRNGKHYTGRHASPRGKTTRKRVGKVVPVAAVAATLAAGTAAAAYGFSSGGHPQASELNAAMSSHAGNITNARTSSAGNANAAGSGLIKIAKATDSSAAHAAAKAAAKASPSAKPTAAATHAAAAATTQAPAAAPATSAPAATTLSCNLNYAMLPDNVTAIVSFLLANGYSDNAAAGIAGNMYQESKGDPESEGMGGGGLIGFTPLPAGYVTGDPAVDLQTQLNAVLTYNQGWASYLPALNAAASPADAAYIYVTDFERAGIPAASTREASAENVASACGI
jgi:Phage tail lysozyme